jgi:uncharacterized Tic20 family protein
MANCSQCQKNVIWVKYCAACKDQLNGTVGSAWTPGQTKFKAENVRAALLHLTPLPALYAALWASLDLSASWLFFLYVVPAFIIRFRPKSTDFERRHANTFINLQISLLIYILVLFGAYYGAFSASGYDTNKFNGLDYSGAPYLITVATVGAAFVLVFSSFIILPLAASLKALKGDDFRYPIAIRFLK